jgi:hypothetical protein
MMSNNIFVLVDDSYCDINDAFINPGGPLPAPEVWKTTYPIDFRLKPLFLEVPYESLTQHCVHRQLWSERFGILSALLSSGARLCTSRPSNTFLYPEPSSTCSGALNPPASALSSEVLSREVDAVQD